MPVDVVHTTLGFTFLAVLAMIGQICIGDKLKGGGDSS